MAGPDLSQAKKKPAQPFIADHRADAFNNALALHPAIEPLAGHALAHLLLLHFSRVIAAIRSGRDGGWGTRAHRQKGQEGSMERKSRASANPA